MDSEQDEKAAEPDAQAAESDARASEPDAQAAEPDTPGAPVPPKWDERDAWTAIADLDEAPALVTARDWPADLEGLERPGLYAWWVDEAGAVALTRGLELELPAGRVYLGQAGGTKWPSGKSNDDALRRRIGQIHLGGKVRMSTFRWTLASILFHELDLEVQASMLITPTSEAALSEWMRAHLSVAVHPHNDRDSLEGLEAELLQLFDPPLNLLRMEATPLRLRLTELRRRISRDV